jgi:hypothetical protein
VGLAFGPADTNLLFWWSNLVASATVHVFFAANVTTNGTPEFWLAGYGLTGGTFQAEDDADQDADGMRTWEEFVADTDPTNGASRLRIVGIGGTLTSLVTFVTASTARQYDVYATTSLLNGSWAGIVTGWPGTNATMTSAVTGDVPQRACRGGAV